MANIVKLKTYRYEIDWSYDYEIEIDIDEWVYFTVDYRGENSWHLIGHKCDKDYNWSQKELSYHWVCFWDMVDFIVKANAVKDKDGFTRCQVSEFNNLHYSKNFYSELARLLEAVKKKEEQLSTKDENKLFDF